MVHQQGISGREREISRMFDKKLAKLLLVSHFHTFRKDIPIFEHLDLLIDTYASQNEIVHYFKISDDLKPLMEREAYDICKYKLKETKPEYSLTTYRCVEITYTCMTSEAIEVLTGSG